MSAQPTAAELLQHKIVIEGLRLAYKESGVGTDRPIEQGGFILRQPSMATYKVVRLPAGTQATLVYPLCMDGTFEGQEIVASFHTHPNTGSEWQQQPSPQDIQLSQNYPETMGTYQFVISKERLYYVNNDGNVTDMGATSYILGIDE